LIITVALPSSLGRSDAATFRNQLIVALEQKESVVVECGGAAALPSLWIQLLHAAAQSAGARGLGITLRGLGDDARASLRAVGFDPARSALVLE